MRAITATATVLLTSAAILTAPASVSSAAAAAPGGPGTLSRFDLARKDPQKFTFGTTSLGSASHLAIELLKRDADIDALPDLARKPAAAPAKAVEATPDPLTLAPSPPAAPLPVPTQVAAR